MKQSIKTGNSTIDVNDIFTVMSQHHFSKRKQIKLLQILDFVLYQKQYPENICGIIERKIKLLEQPEETTEKTQLITQTEDLLDNQEVMQALHISPRTLQTLRSNGTLPFSRIGNKLFYRKQDINTILSSNYMMYIHSTPFRSGTGQLLSPKKTPLHSENRASPTSNGKQNPTHLPHRFARGRTHAPHHPPTTHP